MFEDAERVCNWSVLASRVDPFCSASSASIRYDGDSSEYNWKYCCTLVSIKDYDDNNNNDNFNNNYHNNDLFDNFNNNDDNDVIPDNDKLRTTADVLGSQWIERPETWMAVG